MSLPSKPDATASFDGLDDRESRFVVEYVLRAGERGAGASAALAAGYSNGNRDAAHSMASRLLRRPAVLRALKTEQGHRLALGASVGVNVLEELATGARSEQVRLSAANSLVDRGYGPVISKAAVAVATTSIDDLLKRLAADDEEPAPPTAPSAQVVDAEFTEVPAPPKPQAPSNPWPPPWPLDEIDDAEGE